MSENAFKPQPGQFCWNELITPNPEQAKQFYTDLLGWEYQDVEMPHGGLYSMIKIGDADVGGLMKKPEDAPMPPHWASYIMVEDLDATLEKAKSLGAQIVVEKMQAGEYGYLGVVIDPTGAPISFWQSLQQ